MSRRTTFGSLCGLVFLVNLGRVVFAPLLEPLRAQLGAGDAALGLLATFAWVGSAAPRLPAGYLLTRVPRRHLILCGGAVLAGATALTSLGNSIGALTVGAFLMGLASGVYFIAANPLVSELFPDRVGSALGVHGFAAQLAAAGAPLLVTVALAVGTWRTVVRWMAVFALVSTLAFHLAARRTDLPAVGETDRDFLAAARAQWRLILAALAVIGVAGMVWNGLFNFYVTYMLSKDVPEPAARTLLTVVFAAGLPAFLVSGRLADRLPLVPYMLGIVGAFAACLIALVLASGFWTLAAVGAVTGYVIHSAFPAVDTYLLGSLPDRHRGSAYAVYSASVMLVQAPGSSIVGALSGRFTFDQVYVGAVALILLVLVALAALHWLGRVPTGAAGDPAPATADGDPSA